MFIPANGRFTTQPGRSSLSEAAVQRTACTVAKPQRAADIATATVLAPAAPGLPPRGHLIVGVHSEVLRKVRGSARLTRRTEPPNTQGRVMKHSVGDTERGRSEKI